MQANTIQRSSNSNTTSSTSSSNHLQQHLSAATDDHASSSSSSQVQQHGATLECGLWLAPSTIPNAGLGIFSGRNYKPSERIQETGDVAIPIVDIRFHTGDKDFMFLWDEYTWNAEQLSMDGEGYEDVNVASPGFGAAANCYMPLQNVEEWDAHYNDNRMHRSRDVGAGAFSYWWNRTTTAYRELHAGEEIFVSYGEPWFEGRSYLGPIPLTHDLTRAEKLLRMYRHVRYNATKRGVPTHVVDDVWDQFVKNTQYKMSRVFGAFNHTDKQEMPRLLSGAQNLTEIRIEQSTRSIEWLQKYGTCSDHIYSNTSTIQQAGRGAFASRFLPKGTGKIGRMTLFLRCYC